MSGPYNVDVELVRKQTYITPEQDSALKRLARRDGTTEAEIIRRAIDHWLVSEGIETRGDPYAPVIAIFDGPNEVNHNDILRKS